MTNKNTELIERLRELRSAQFETAYDQDMDPKQTANWAHAETCGLAIEALKVRSIESAAVPEGWKLVMVKGFDDLMYWLERCDDKGHLENCADLLEPWAAFDYREAAPQPSEPASAKPLPLTISGHQLSEALEFLAPDGTDEQLGQEVCIQQGLEGLYCWLEDCPEEGSIVLIGEPLPASAAADMLAADAQQVPPGYTAIDCPQCGFVGCREAQQVAAPQAPTQEMVTAYLMANDAYWKRTDELPKTNPSKWRQGTPSEATYEALCAALAAAPPASQARELSDDERLAGMAAMAVWEDEP